MLHKVVNMLYGGTQAQSATKTDIKRLEDMILLRQHPATEFLVERASADMASIQMPSTEPAAAGAISLAANGDAEHPVEHAVEHPVPVIQV